MGTFVARVDLLTPVPADVYIGVGFFSGQHVAGRKIAYRGFEV
jgi:hypothetical protein